MKTLLALDFGGTFVKHSLVDQNGVLTERAEYAAPLESAEAFVNTVKMLYEKYQREVDGIALSMPGIIDSDKGILHTAGAYTPVLGGKNIFQLLGDFGTRISVENDGKASILAEAWKGALQGVSSAAAIIIGSGLGGGIMMNGMLYKGVHFSSAEFGCMPSEIGTYTPTSSIAHKAGMSALLKNVALAKGMHPQQFEIAGIRSRDKADPTLPIYSGQDVFRWIDEGDPITCQVYEKWLAALVYVIYSLKLVLDPEKIVIGGGVSRNNRLLDDLKREYEKTRNMIITPGLLELELVTCQLTADANMIGAVYNWLLHFDKQEI